MCDGHDIGLSIDGGDARAIDAHRRHRRRARRAATEPNIFIYDNYPGGIGFSRPLFEMHALLLDADARADRRLSVRVGLPVVRRARGEHRSASPSSVASRHPRAAARRRTPRLHDELIDAPARHCARRCGRQARPGSRPHARRRVDRRRTSLARAHLRAGHRRATRRRSISTRVADVLGGRRRSTRSFGRAPRDRSPLRVGSLPRHAPDRRLRPRGRRRCGCSIRRCRRATSMPAAAPIVGTLSRGRCFVDLETTGLSGGAGTVAFLVGCGWFDLGAFQVRQFLLTSYASERALLCAVAECFDGAVAARHLQRQDLRRAGDGDALAVPPACRMPLESVRALRHAASGAAAVARRAPDAGDDPASSAAAAASATLERVLLRRHARRRRPGMRDSRRATSTSCAAAIARPLEPVLEHNRLDLVSLAAVMARAVAARRATAARGAATRREALALGRVYERAGADRRARWRATSAPRAERVRAVDVVGRGALPAGAAPAPRSPLRRGGGRWRRLIELTEPRAVRRIAGLPAAAVRRRSARHPSRASRTGLRRGARAGAVRLLETSRLSTRAGDASASPGPARAEARPKKQTPSSFRAGVARVCRAVAAERRPALTCEARYLAARASAFSAFLAFAAALRLSDVCTPNRLVNRSTRPSVSTSFWRPVKNGWQLLQISRCSSGLVDRVFHVAPHAQRASMS